MAAFLPSYGHVCIPAFASGVHARRFRTHVAHRHLRSGSFPRSPIDWSEIRTAIRNRDLDDTEEYAIFACRFLETRVCSGVELAHMSDAALMSIAFVELSGAARIVAFREQAVDSRSVLDNMYYADRPGSPGF